MKTSKDPRHQKRITLMQSLFTWQFNPEITPKEIKGVVADIKKIDKIIAKGAPDRPLNQINKIDLAILRLAVFELTVKKDTPPKVIIDEAIELGKEYGSDSSSRLINGVLGKVVTIKKIKT